MSKFINKELCVSHSLVVQKRRWAVKTHCRFTIDSYCVSENVTKTRILVVSSTNSPDKISMHPLCFRFLKVAREQIMRFYVKNHCFPQLLLINVETEQIRGNGR